MRQIRQFFKTMHRRARIFLLRTQRWVMALPLRTRIIAASGVAVFAVALTLVLVLTHPAEAGTVPLQALDADIARAEDGFIDEGIITITAPTPAPTPVQTPTPTPTPVPDPTLRRGMESEEVQAAQERLMYLGFLDIDESTLLFGPQTEAAVKLFQRQINFTPELEMTITEDGILGPISLDLLYSDAAPKYIVKLGMEGPDIEDMQQQLKDMGYMSKVTGLYGDTTTEAIRAFQDRNSLSADGLCGPITFALLYSPDARESKSKAAQARTTANIDKMISIAKDMLGKPYLRGGRGPKNFDCSGLVYYCLNEAGSNRRRLSAAGYAQVSDWEKITSISSLKRGDLIFFYDDGFTKIGHVGIIINSSEMIDASSSKGKVVRREYKTSYWRAHFYCGRRPW